MGLASAHQAQGHLDLALRYDREALDIFEARNPEDPNVGEVLVNMGEVLRLQGKPAEALESYRKALAISGEDSGRRQSEPGLPPERDRARPPDARPRRRGHRARRSAPSPCSGTGREIRSTSTRLASSWPRRSGTAAATAPAPASSRGKPARGSRRRGPRMTSMKPRPG